MPADEQNVVTIISTPDHPVVFKAGDEVLSAQWEVTLCADGSLTVIAQGRRMGRMLILPCANNMVRVTATSLNPPQPEPQLEVTDKFVVDNSCWLIEQPESIKDGVWFFKTFVSHSGATGGVHLPEAEVRLRLKNKAGPGVLLRKGGLWYWQTAVTQAVREVNPLAGEG